MEMVDASLEDTHQELRTKILEFGVDSYDYYVRCNEGWHPDNDIERYRNNFEQSLEYVLQWIQTNYQRKVINE